MHQLLEILQTSTNPKPMSTTFNLQLIPSHKVSLQAVVYGRLVTVIIMEIIPESPPVCPCCCLELCCPVLSCAAHTLANANCCFYLCYRKAVPGQRSTPAQELYRQGKGVPASSCGASLLFPAMSCCPACTHWGLLPSQRKLNTCFPSTSQPL